MPYRANNVALEIQVASMTTVEQDIRYTISVETSRKSHSELPKWIYIKLSNGMSSHCSVNSNRYDTVWFCFFFPSGDSSYLFPFRKNKNRLHARHTERERETEISPFLTFSRYASSNCKPSLCLLTLCYQRKINNTTVNKLDSGKRRRSKR